MTVKITSLEAENVKRIKAVRLEPSPTGLTVIGGRNNQGKTSVLDSIAWALGGNKFKPSQPHRDGSVLDPMLKVTLSNGIVVERKGKNSDLKVIDPEGKKSGQQLLNQFIGELALDIPRFMEASDKDKANTLLQIIGVGEQLAQLDMKEKQLYQKRLFTGRDYEVKAKHAQALPHYPDVPQTPISSLELVKQQQEILAKNGMNQEMRNRLQINKTRAEEVRNQIGYLQNQINAFQAELNRLLQDISTGEAETAGLIDQSTAEIEANLSNVEQINAKIRSNLDKAKAETEADALKTEYEDLTNQIEIVRSDRMDLLKAAPLPLPGLSVEEGKLTYNGQQWDNMSGSDQLRVATAIVRKLNPECGFVLLDKLEQMDMETLRDFGQWLESQGLQAIATRVSTGDECSIIISDGQVQGEPEPIKKEFSGFTWNGGAFK